MISMKTTNRQWQTYQSITQKKAFKIYYSKGGECSEKAERSPDVSHMHSMKCFGS